MLLLRCNIEIESEQIIYVATRRKQKPPRNLCGKILGGCVYSDSDAEGLLPLVIVILVVEKFVDEFVNNV